MLNHFFIISVLLIHSSLASSQNHNGDEISKREGEVMLMGLFVNDKELGNIDVLEISNTQYITLELLTQRLGIKPIKVKDGWQFDSPIGSTTINKGWAVLYQKKNYVPLTALKVLGIHAKYHAPLMAISLYVPWDSNSPKRIQNYNTNKEKKIDYYPEYFGLGGISISGGFNRHVNITQADINKTNFGTDEKNIDTLYTYVGMIGYLSGGLWGADVQYDQSKLYFNNESNINIDSEKRNENPLMMNNLFWSKSWDNWAVRLGTSNSGFGVGFGEYTGATFAYSNKNIKKHLAYPSSNTLRLLNDSDYTSSRNIKGTGPAGGIAELRANGYVIARVRIGLDKKYEFTEVNLNNYNSGDYNIEVAIFEYSVSEPPILVYRPALYPLRSNVDNKELLIVSGLGQKGNAFNTRDRDKSPFLVNTYVEYGLTNNISVRSSFARSDEEPMLDGKKRNSAYENMLGINLGLPFQINVDVSYENSREKDLLKKYLYYRHGNKYIDVNYNFQHINYRYNNTYSFGDFIVRQEEHYLNVNLKPHKRLSLGLYGTHRKTNRDISGIEKERSFTMNLNAHLYDNLSININKNHNNDYRSNLTWNIPKWRTHVYANKEKGGYITSISKRLTDTLNIGTSLTKWRNVNTYYSYIEYQHSDRQKIHFGVNRFKQENSFSLNWQYRFNGHGLIDLGYRKNQSAYSNNLTNTRSNFGDGDYFYLKFSFDLVKKEGGGLTLGHYRPSYSGTLVTNLNMNDVSGITLYDKVQVQLDGYTVDAYKVSNKQYRIENIRPGVYELTFPTEGLPFEYQPSTLKKPIIKVAEAATTVVDYNLEKTYGISGQLLTEEQNKVISVYRDGEKIAETHTQVYGYYQFIGLSKGEYVLKTVGHDDKRVTINDAFLFEVNI